MGNRTYFVYIMGSKSGVIYIGYKRPCAPRL